MGWGLCACILILISCCYHNCEADICQLLHPVGPVLPILATERKIDDALGSCVGGLDLDCTPASILSAECKSCHQDRRSALKGCRQTPQGGRFQCSSNRMKQTDNKSGEAGEIKRPSFRCVPVNVDAAAQTCTRSPCLCELFDSILNASIDRIRSSRSSILGQRLDEVEVASGRHAMLPAGHCPGNVGA